MKPKSGKDQLSPSKTKKKKNNDSSKSTDKKIIEEFELVEATQAHSHNLSHYFTGAFFSLIVALSAISILMASSFHTGVYDFSSKSMFGGVFVDAGGLTTISVGDGYHSSRSNPSLCNDGYTYGYSNWNDLRMAIDEANIYAESLASMDDAEWIIDDFGVAMSSLPPPSPEPFVICPGVTLRNNNKQGAIFIDSENIIVECDSCAIDVGGTHFAFGQNAKGTTIRGITFRNARSSSLTFYHHGADVAFEDCAWEKNAGTGNAGAIADLNSTRLVSFELRSFASSSYNCSHFRRKFLLNFPTSLCFILLALSLSLDVTYLIQNRCL